MEIVIAAGVAVIAAALAWFLRGRTAPAPRQASGPAAARPAAALKAAASPTPSHAQPAPRPDVGRSEPPPGIAEAELQARREEVVRMEERVLHDEQALHLRIEDLERRSQSLDDRERNLDQQAEALKSEKRRQRIELERLSGLSAAQAKQILLKELEEEARQQAAVTLMRIEEETKRDAERRARGILSVAMQRLAGQHASESTVRMVELPNDEMKGRVIGRDGRNIRALENLTGVDFIIDETPSAVVLSSFDGVRREIARLTLEKLIADGRISPARCEEAYEQARAEIKARIKEQGEQAVLAANIHPVDPGLVELLGRLKYRTSYGQNVLDHLVECSRLAAIMAEELGASTQTAARAALLHDIGKAVTHEVEGPHALVGGELARRHGETEAVAHAMEAHHNEVEPRTVEAVIVQAADALSGARPGARGDSLEHYVERLHDLEEIASRHSGVERVYAMRAGREVRVMVDPGEVDDEGAALISHDIARAVERTMEYPGQIKITVIRESRSTSYAK